MRLFFSLGEQFSKACVGIKEKIIPYFVKISLVGADIAAYKFGNRFNHEPKSMRKLLVHAKEVRDLQLKTEAKGLTLIPLKVFLKNGRIKVDLGVCRGKQLHDKRDALKKKALRRDLERGG